MKTVNPWDRFATRMHGTGDVITNSAGDTLVHDEILIHTGDLRGDAITAVMCHAHDRFIARWGPLLNRPHNLPKPLVTRGFLTRYNKWEV